MSSEIDKVYDVRGAYFPIYPDDESHGGTNFYTHSSVRFFNSQIVVDMLSLEERNQNNNDEY